MLFQSTWTRQPQQPVPIDRGNPITRGLVRFANAALATPSGVLVDSADPSVTYTSATPALATNAAGRSLAKASTALWVGSSAKAQDAIGTGDFTMFGGGVNTGTSSSEYLCMIGTSGTSATGFTFLGNRTGSVIALNTFNGTLAVAPVAAHIAGRFECIVAARRGGTVFFFQNGQYLGSAAHASSVVSQAFSLNSNSNTSHDVNFAGLFTRGLSDAECRSLSENPWQLFQPTSRKIWVPASAGAGSHTLVGANSTQTNTSGTDAISQTHVLAGAASTQANTSGTGAVTQAHQLAGAGSSQANTSGTGAISQTHVLAGANSTQANTSGTGAITLGAVHTLVGANSTQANTSSAGAISQVHMLVAAPSVQDNIASASAIVQMHMLAGAACSQTATSGTGAIVVGDIAATVAGARTRVRDAVTGTTRPITTTTTRPARVHTSARPGR